MNKKNLLLLGFAVVMGYMTITAFGGQTKEQQEAQINDAVTAKVDEFRTSLKDACTARVMTEAQTRYDAFVAEQAAAAAAKPGLTKKSGTKKTTGPKVDPLPQGTKPAPVQESQSKWNKNNPSGVQESQSKWQKAPDPANKDAAPAPVQESKSKWNKGGGGK